MRLNQSETSNIFSLFTEYDKQVLFDDLAFDYKYYENGDLRFNDSCNFMKIGIVYADFVTTVSETYAKEIQTPELGCKLDTILKYLKTYMVLSMVLMLIRLILQRIMPSTTSTITATISLAKEKTNAHCNISLVWKTNQIPC